MKKILLIVTAFFLSMTAFCQTAQEDKKEEKKISFEDIMTKAAKVDSVNKKDTLFEYYSKRIEKMKQDMKSRKENE